jgi:hypothetical protein
MRNLLAASRRLVALALFASGISLASAQEAPVAPAAQAVPASPPAAKAPAGPPLATEVLFTLNAGRPLSQVKGLAFTQDSQYLCLGGTDKVVHVVPADPLSPPTSQTLRWELEWGQMGTINALAREGTTGAVVIGGYGYRGRLGDLAWLDPATGRQIALEHFGNAHPGAVLYEAGQQSNFGTPGHRQVIAALASSPASDWIVSTDVSGATLARSRNRRAHLVLQGGDALPFAPIRPVAIAGSHLAAVPRYLDAGQRNFNTARWAIDLVDLEASWKTGSVARVGQPLMSSRGALLTALSASADGKWLVAGDLAQQIYVWNLTAPGQPPAIYPVPDRVALALACHPTLPVVMMGAQRAVAAPSGAKTFAGQLLFLDLARAAWGAAIKTDSPIAACAFRPDGRQIACAQLQGNEVLVSVYPAAGALAPLPGTRTMASGVFAYRDNKYELSYAEPVGAALRWKRLEFDTLAEDIVDPLAPPRPAPGPWQVSASEPGVLQLSRGGAPGPQVRWDAERHGRAGAHTWLTVGGRSALAVSMENSRDILVFDMDAPGYPLLRAFWGHTGIVTSLAPLGDPQGRYLVSTALDGTARVWSLQTAADADPVRRRWGAALQSGEGGLVIAGLDDNGPLFNKGTRPGDALTAVQWIAGGKLYRYEKPDAMVAELARVPPHTTVAFETVRDGKPRPVFQVIDGFYHLLAVLAAGGEWIAWNPAGYYACSGGGERLIGWQVNNEVGQPPSFFAATQFNKVFHRPDVIQKLLATGQVSRALAAAAGAPAPVPAIVDLLPPKVNVEIAASARPLPADAEVPVRVRAESRTGEEITSVQLRINGRPYGPPQKVSGKSVEVPFAIQPPPGDSKIEALANTASSVGKSEAAPVTIQESPTKRRGRTLFVLSIGVGTYADSKHNLEAPAGDARTLAETFTKHYAQGTRHDEYAAVDVRMLVDQEATLAGINAALAKMIADMRPRDAGVIFFSGHGFNEGKMYLAPHDFDDARLAETCLSDETLGQHFLKCQNYLMLILNSCYAGAARLASLQPARDMALTLGRDDFAVRLLGACEGGDKAQQRVFSGAVIQALKGDADHDIVLGQVDTDELPRWVKNRVLLDSEQRQITVVANESNFRDFLLTKKIAEAGRPAASSGN